MKPKHWARVFVIAFGAATAGFGFTFLSWKTWLLLAIFLAHGFSEYAQGQEDGSK